MFSIRLFAISLALAVSLSACGPAQIVPSVPQPLPSPSESWSLSLTQSGGIAGTSLQLNVWSDGKLIAVDQRSGHTVTQILSAQTLSRLQALLAAAAAVTPQPSSSSCADCFIYDLEVTSGTRTVKFHADDTTLGSSGARELITFLRQLRDDALKGQP